MDLVDVPMGTSKITGLLGHFFTRRKMASDGSKLIQVSPFVPWRHACGQTPEESPDFWDLLVTGMQKNHLKCDRGKIV
jgi:hypothetical protein